MLVFLTSEGFFVDGPFGLLLLLRFVTALSSTIILFVPGSISVPFSSSSINGRFLSGSERAGRLFAEEEVDEGGCVGGGAEAAIIFARASGAILLLLV